MSRRWLEPLPDAEQMRATDRWAIEERGVPSLDLMERAGEGLAAVVARHAPGGRIAVVCGKGNNGGDGLVAARLLRQAGRAVDVLAVAPPEELRGDAAEQLRRLPGEPPEPFDAGRLDGAGGIVDAVLGTGATGAPREPAGVIEAMNGAGGAGRRRRRALRRRRVDRRGGRAGRPRGRHRDLPPRPSRGSGSTRQGARGRGGGDRHRHPGGRAGGAARSG